MKHIAITLILLFAVISVGNTQEYTVIYETKTEIPDSLRELLPKDFEENLNTVLCVKDSLMNFKVNTVDQNLDVEFIINTQQQKAVMLINSDKGNIAKKVDSNYHQKFPGQNVKLKFMSEQRIILGQTCLKAQSEDKLGVFTTIWYVPGYSPSISIMGYVDERIPGIIMEYISEFTGMKVIVKATSFERNVENPKEVFDFTIPEGYEVKE